MIKQIFNEILSNTDIFKNIKNIDKHSIFICKYIDKIKKFGDGSEKFVIVMELKSYEHNIYKKFENLGNNTIYLVKISVNNIYLMSCNSKHEDYLPSSTLYYCNMLSFNSSFIKKYDNVNVYNLPNKLKVLKLDVVNKLITPLNLHKIIINLHTLIKLKKKSKITSHKLCLNFDTSNTFLILQCNKNIKIKTQKIKKYYINLEDVDKGLIVKLYMNKDMYSNDVLFNLKNNNKINNIEIKEASLFENGLLDFTLKKKHILKNTLNQNENKFVNYQEFINNLLKNKQIINFNITYNYILQKICLCFILYFTFYEIYQYSFNKYYNIKTCSIFSSKVYNIVNYMIKMYYMLNILFSTLINLTSDFNSKNYIYNINTKLLYKMNIVFLKVTNKINMFINNNYDNPVFIIIVKYLKKIYKCITATIFNIFNINGLQSILVCIMTIYYSITSSNIFVLNVFYGIIQFLNLMTRIYPKKIQKNNLKKLFDKY